MPKHMEGIYPPVITSFTADGDIYEKGIRNVISYLIGKGVHGFFINGSYGSAVLMTLEERKRVAEIIHDEVQGRLPIISHIGAASTRATIELARHAEGLGSAAVAAFVPYYYPGVNAYDDSQIIRHYAEVAASVGVPLFMYNNPRTTGYSLTPELLAELVKAGVAGMKDSSGSFTLLGEFNQAATAVNPDFVCMSGSVGLLQPAFNLGIKGCIAGTANAFPELALDLYGGAGSQGLGKVGRAAKPGHCPEEDPGCRRVSSGGMLHVPQTQGDRLRHGSPPLAGTERTGDPVHEAGSHETRPYC